MKIILSFLSLCLVAIATRAGSGMSVSKVQNEDGSDASGSLFVPASVVDLIESDYH